MKTPITLALALLAVAPVSAQVFRPQTVNGAVLGGIAGAVIGNNSGSLGHNAWKGAAIGAVAGGVIGSLSADQHDRRGGDHSGGYYGGGGYVYRHSPAVYGGYYRGGYGPYRGGYYGGYYGSVGYYPTYSYYPSYGYYGSSYASDGLFLGALAGGIIGHNSGSFRHNGWRGAAWGAGIGWLLGSVADANRRAAVWEQPVYVQPAVQQQAAPAAQPAAQPQQVTIINNYYGNAAPMSQANSLFGR